MKEPSSPSGDSPPELSDTDSYTGVENGETPSMRWYHWLGFFSPGVVSVSFFAAGGRSDHGLEWGLEWGLPGVILGMVICLINSFWLPRRSGIGGFYFGLLVNAAFACGWQAIVFSR